jgi:hypothetical protein
MGEYLIIVKAVLAGVVIFSGLFFGRKYLRETRRKAIITFAEEMGFKEVDIDKDGHPTFNFKVKDKQFTIRQSEISKGKGRAFLTTVSASLNLDINQSRHIGIKRGSEIIVSLEAENPDLFSYGSINNAIKATRNAVRGVTGIQDIQIGDPELDDKFCIKGSSEVFVKKLFSEEVVDQFKSLYKVSPYLLVVDGASVTLKRMDHVLDTDFYKAATIFILLLMNAIHKNSLPEKA